MRSPEAEAVSAMLRYVNEHATDCLQAKSRRDGGDSIAYMYNAESMTVLFFEEKKVESFREPIFLVHTILFSPYHGGMLEWNPGSSHVHPSGDMIEYTKEDAVSMWKQNLRTGLWKYYQVEPKKSAHNYTSNYAMEA
tara:strand:+ start:1137 stop:1547 length:411 start_codon:yes stop_codon:yes gene_type:complete